MAIIRKQNEIDVYANTEEKMVIICEKDGHFDMHGGGYEDAFINIDVDHIDTVIAALQKCKAEILAGNEVGNG
ncbi:hypothetical protein GPS47_14125 [Acinetobacter haemolyticus]|uniref:hypothetical protein n=1 Tax=Acinetobacter haemolyticus TaxID=29430 RepID=UPI000E58B51E|nr:hypothetical protein [Acinetobacter haemolyticus]NAR50133.1 hypothetical protein [Acinetobacter haemolyticus]NAR55614.1 hypothetical protein [Acinetobacter haemolyticus]NAS06692.1 hypothetical protein [Acinetobacter haemolyticus]QDJ92713.1 hypothetical protein AhaeAN54_011840 [Acinetobacter haemolyticus]QHI29007.1 hypothetical protein AhaeINNSZ174_05750 [Acinetobacter haemolyticus]